MIAFGSEPIVRLLVEIVGGRVVVQNNNGVVIALVMQAYDTISLVAEIAATILGFSGVVVAFQRKAIQKFGPRLLDLVFNAVAALLFSLVALPVITSQEAGTFQKEVLEALIGTYLVGHLIFLSREFWLGIYRRAPHDSNPYLVVPFLITNLIVLVTVSREVGSGGSSWTAYTWGVIFLVILAAYLFARMIWLTWHELNTSE